MSDYDYDLGDLYRVQAGDYLFSIDDTIWRVSRYDDPTMIERPHGWQLHRMSEEQLRRLVARAQAQRGELPAWDTWGWSTIDPFDWQHWRYAAGGFRTRRDAVDNAVRGAL